MAEENTAPQTPAAEKQTPMLAKIHPKIVQTIAHLQETGYTAYIVGGAVRDFLLERTPKDYDLATSATPEEVKRAFRKKRCFIIGRRFRLVHLYAIPENHDPIEISTFRRSPDPEDQHTREGSPDHLIMNDNEYGTAEDDAFRRDFTVNALFYDPVHDKLLDYTGLGESDIKNGIVRCIGNPALRFEEDPVRILRALKLVGQYGFTLEAETEKALRECMPMIRHVSASRLSLEFEKITRNPYGSSIIATFRKYGFLQYFMPYLDKRFETPAGQYVMELWRKRDERVQAGIFRPSISMMTGLFCLPFVEEQFGSEPGQVWPAEDTTYAVIRNMIRQVTAPHAITRVQGCNAASLLYMQSYLFARKKIHNFNRTGYPAARELAAIQNELKWNQEDFETFYPCAPVQTRSRKRKKKKKISAAKPEVPAVKPPFWSAVWNKVSGIFSSKKLKSAWSGGRKRTSSKRKRTPRSPFQD